MKKIISLTLVMAVILTAMPFLPASAEEADTSPTEETVIEESASSTEETTQGPTEGPAEPAEVEHTEDGTQISPEFTPQEPEQPLDPAADGEQEPIDLQTAEESTALDGADGVATSGTCGENLTWSFDEETGTLTISGIGEMATDAGYQPWADYTNQIISVVLLNGITSIGDHAFIGCENLTSIAIPNSITIIGDFAFQNCDILTSVVIPDGTTGIGMYAFSWCDSLTRIDIPDSITNIGDHAFIGCFNLTGIKIPDGVTDIKDSTFNNCSSLTSIIIPDGVSSIGDDAFYGCSNLTSVTLPDSVTSIGNSAFYWCSSLTSVSIPDSVTSIGNHAFYGCSSLTSVSIPDGVTSIGNHAFYGCSSLTSVSIPDGVTSVGEYTFYDCSSLTSVTIPDGVTSIGEYAFYYCSSLTSFTIPNGVTQIEGHAFDGCYNLDRLIIPVGVTYIGDLAFDSVYGVIFLGNAPETDGANGLFDEYNWSERKVLYPQMDTTWSQSVKETLAGKANVSWIPFPETQSSGICGTNLTWQFDDMTGALTISGSGKMDSWDWVTVGAPWIYYYTEIDTVVIGAGVTGISGDAFRYLGSISIHFLGDAPAFEQYALDGDDYGTLTVYYPQGNDTWAEVIQQFPSVIWIPEGSAFSSLHEIAKSCETMTPEEIRAAVQALDRDELLTALRSSTVAADDLATLDMAIRKNGVKTIITSDDPRLYGAGFYEPYVTGTYLNDLIEPSEPVTMTIGNPTTAIAVPNGYRSEGALHFSVSFDNLQSPQMLKVPVELSKGFGGDDSINPMLQGVFWRNPKSGQIEEIPSTAQWEKEGIYISFIITGEGDYVIAPKEEPATGSCGDNLTWTYDESGTLTITGSGKMYDYGKNSNVMPWFSCHENIEGILFNDGITEIGAFAFYDCRFTYRMTFPASVSSIGAGAFGGMYNMTTLVFEGDAPSVAPDSFTGVNDLKIYYPEDNLTWAKVVDTENWGGAESCTWIPITTSGSCGDNLTWQFDAQTGTLTIRGTGEMGNWEVDSIPPWEPYYDRIKKIVILDGVTSIGAGAFGNCKIATEIVIPGSVTSLGYYSIPSSLKDFTIPVGVTDIDSFLIASFGNFENLYVTEGNPAYSSVNGVLFNKDKTVLIRCPASRTGEYTVQEGVIRLGEWSFEGCDFLTKLTLPNSLETIEAFAIDCCNGLKELVIPDGVTRLDAQCIYGEGLDRVIVGKGVTEFGTGDYGSVISGGTHLSAIVFKGDAPNFGERAFQHQQTTVYYPADNETWTADVMQDYGGTITWVPYTQEMTLGDVNGDGEVTSLDAARIYAFANNKMEPTEEEFLAADVDGDGAILSVDAAMVYSYANNQLDKFPIEK